MEIEDQNNESEFVEVYNVPGSPEDLKFDQIISALQEIVIDPDFEKTLTKFMRNHWNVLDSTSDKQQLMKVFELYRADLKQYLQAHIIKSVPDFNWVAFGQLFDSRKNIIDEQLLDTLLSFEDPDSFKSFIKDYRNSYQEEELFKTIKSTKIPETKKVKGKDNIFAGGAAGSDMFGQGLKAPLPKKPATKQAKQKTEDELMVPDLILTVKPLRKS